MDADNHLEVVVKKEIEDESSNNSIPPPLFINQPSEKPVIETEHENPVAAEKEKEKSHNDEQEDLLKIVPKAEGLVSLLVKDVLDDVEEETVIMTNEEVCDYIHEAYLKYLADPKVNPRSKVDAKLAELQEEFKEKYEECTKLNKVFEQLLRQQGAFLRPNGVLLKGATKDIGVSVDMPLLYEPLQTPKLSQPPKVEQKSDSSKDNIECIDLTDDSESSKDNATPQKSHPAPLPSTPPSAASKDPPPPKPRLKISAEERGIVLQWDLPTACPSVTSFDIFGYQESQTVYPSSSLWKKIGSVRSMHLPMACTLTQFVEGHRYHFAIRAVDARGRCGPYSDPISIVYKQTQTK